MVNLDCGRHPTVRRARGALRVPEPLGQARERHADLEAGLEGAVASANEERRGLVRKMLRHGGYKPSGRGKPSSEYLARAWKALASTPPWTSGISPARRAACPSTPWTWVARQAPALRTACAAEGRVYVFNASGQEIDLKGLLCLFDAEGPCANAVKDAQRTKAAEDSTDCLFIVWCPSREVETGAATLERIASMAEAMGATCEAVAPCG